MWQTGGDQCFAGSIGKGVLGRGNNVGKMRRLESVQSVSSPASGKSDRRHQLRGESHVKELDCCTWAAKGVIQNRYVTSPSSLESASNEPGTKVT